ncbi:MAG: hypothetical protein ACR2QB_01550 [Gammaproteobacteria bacterium]
MYPLLFGAEIKAGQQRVQTFIQVKQSTALLQEVRLRAPTKNFGNFAGDGEILRKGDQLIWRPPATGGELRYRSNLRQRRDGGSYDALVERNWALFRLDDLFPPAGISQADGSQSRSRLQLTVPEGWQAVTRYPAGKGGIARVNNPARKFDRPTGWSVAGRLGIRRDKIDGLQVTVAGPISQGIQRVSMLALMRWTLPELLDIVPEPPANLLVVSAGEPMWRGGLSGPDSLYLHADLPLLSEDGTSTLLHESVHALLPVPTVREHDWIDEGLAEYLTLELLLRSGTISQRRFDAAIEKFRRRGRSVQSLLTPRASGAVTARAVVLFHDLAADLSRATDNALDITDLARRLAQEPAPVDFAGLEAIATAMGQGQAPPSLIAARMLASGAEADM